MNLNEGKMLRLAGIIKESEMLNEVDTKFYATPEHVEQNLKLAFDLQMKKFKKLAKKGYFTSSETERMFTTFGHGSNWSSPDKSKQRELRKKYGTPEEQDRKKK